MDPTALLAGAALFDSGRYFEAHEVWERPWLREPDPQVRRFYQALIQLAAGFHKLRAAGNLESARRLLRKANAKLADLPDALAGMHLAELRRAAQAWERALDSAVWQPPSIGPLLTASNSGT